MRTALSTEQPRLEAISHYALSDMPQDPALDDIARLAAQVCEAPVGAVSIIEEDQITILGRFGLDLSFAPRQSLPCETAIEGQGVYQVHDARLDTAYAPLGIPISDRRYTLLCRRSHPDAQWRRDRLPFRDGQHRAQA